MNYRVTKLILFRRSFALETKPRRTLGLAEKPNPESVATDYIGPPDQKSNLRPYVRHIPKNETNLEKSLREKRTEVEIWNEDFWSKHNKRFYEEKKDFVQRFKVNENEESSADKMSIFYKHFLDKNKKMHMLYNVSWYCKNADLLMTSLQVQIQKLFNKLRNKKIEN